MAHQVTASLLTQVLSALNRAAREAKFTADFGPLADQLGAAIAADQALRAAGGAKGGASSKGAGRSGHWLRITDGEWTDWVRGAGQAATAIAERYGKEVINKHSLGVYLSRGNGSWGTRVTYDDRDLALQVRKAKPAEIKRLEAE